MPSTSRALAWYTGVHVGKTLIHILKRYSIKTAIENACILVKFYLQCCKSQIVLREHHLPMQQQSYISPCLDAPSAPSIHVEYTEEWAKDIRPHSQNSRSAAICSWRLWWVLWGGPSYRVQTEAVSESHRTFWTLRGGGMAVVRKEKESLFLCLRELVPLFVSLLRCQYDLKTYV